MAKSSSAKRYADAVFQLALETGQLEQWARDLTSMASVFKESGAQSILRSKTIKPADKDKFLALTLTGISPVAMNLARMLVARDGVGAATEIAIQYQEMMDKHQGVERGEVVTAIDITPEQQKTIASSLEKIVGHKVILTTRKDPIVVAGFVARVGGKVIDGSVRTKLLELQKELLQSSV
ncbi:MAG: ATP synthase F1 subunit delta [Dehalococcoidia bacterium]|nr:ATP synthase F1 subunit delta [Dehalococcoidia bacterium]